MPSVMKRTSPPRIWIPKNEEGSSHRLSFMQQLKSSPWPGERKRVIQKHQSIQMSTQPALFILYLQHHVLVPLCTQFCWPPWPAHLCPEDVVGHSGNTGSVSRSTLVQAPQLVLAAGTKETGCDLTWLDLMTQIPPFCLVSAFFSTSCTLIMSHDNCCKLGIVCFSCLVLQFLSVYCT